MGDWAVAQVIKETAKGEINRYRVTGPNNYKYPTEFRHNLVAATVASILNETNGSVADARLVRIEELCTQEISLMKEIRQHKETYKATPKGNTSKREIIEGKAQEANRKLNKVRTSLGVK
jgi:hypothetical protein